MPEIRTLLAYVEFLKGTEGEAGKREKPKKADKLAWIAAHPEANWEAMGGSGAAPAAAKANARIKELKASAALPEGSDLGPLRRAGVLFDELAEAKKAEKAAREELEAATKKRVEGISEADALAVLRAKWIAPLVRELEALKPAAVAEFERKAETLIHKYDDTMAGIDSQIREAEDELSAMLGQLVGTDRDMAGIEELMRVLGGE